MSKGYTHPVQPILQCSFQELVDIGEYSNKLLEALEGSMLGDGNAEFWGYNARFRIDLAEGHFDALKVLHDILVEMEPGLRRPYYVDRKPVNAKHSRACCMETRLHPLITWFFWRWYWVSPEYVGIRRTKKDETRKVLPSDIEITPISVLFWYIGDGCLRWLKGKPWTVGSGPLLTLATSCFTEKEVRRLSCKIWEELQVASTVFCEIDKRRPKSAYWNINISDRENVSRFFKFISIPELIPDSYLYRFAGYVE